MITRLRARKNSLFYLAVLSAFDMLFGIIYILVFPTGFLAEYTAAHDWVWLYSAWHVYLVPLYAAAQVRVRSFFK